MGKINLLFAHLLPGFVVAGLYFTNALPYVPHYAHSDGELGLEEDDDCSLSRP